MNISIVYFSGHGHTKRVAEKIREGAINNASCDAICINVNDLTTSSWDILARSDAIIFGSPTYMGSAAAQFKNFMDQASGDIWTQQAWKNKIAAGFTVATHPSGDMLNTLFQLTIFAAQHGMIWVGNAEVGSTILKDGLGVNSNGSWLGLMTTSISDKSKLIHANDEISATKFGARIASISTQFSA